MKNIALLSAGLAAMIVPLLPATPAEAANDVSFVQSTGSDANPCTRAQPCTSFHVAHNATNPGGEINCLDSGPFVNLGVITKSITIDCAGKFNNGFAMNGSGIVVTIRNLSISGVASTGIDFGPGAALFVENCVIQNFNAGAAIGIRFRPGSSGAQLVVTDTIIRNNGIGSIGGGIVVSPQEGGTASVTLNRVTVAKNVFGIAADGTGSTGGINMVISDSVISGNSQDGIIATTPSGGAPMAVMVKNTRTVHNNFGIRSIGPNVTVRVDGSSVTGNSTGLSFSSGGALLTTGNNLVRANGTDGSFSGSVGLQ